MRCKECKNFVKFGKVKGKQRYKCIKCGSSTIKNINNNSLIDRRKTNSGNPKGNPIFNKELIKEIKKKSKDYDKRKRKGEFKIYTDVSKYKWIKEELKKSDGDKFPSLCRYYQITRRNKIFY